MARSLFKLADIEQQSPDLRIRVDVEDTMFENVPGVVAFNGPTVFDRDFLQELLEFFQSALMPFNSLCVTLRINQETLTLNPRDGVNEQVVHLVNNLAAPSGLLS